MNATITDRNGKELGFFLNHEYFGGTVIVECDEYGSYAEIEIWVNYTKDQQKEFGPSYSWDLQIDTRDVNNHADVLRELSTGRYDLEGGSCTL